MDASLKAYLGPQKSAALEKFLDGLIARPDTPFIGSGIWPLDGNYRYMEVDPTGDNDSLWTHVTVSVRNIVGKSTAEELLRMVDEAMDKELSLETKPPRVSYSLEDDSNTLYQAKSLKIQGTRPVPGRELPSEFVYQMDDSYIPTPPGSPKGDYIVNTEFIEIDLAPKRN